MNEFYRNIEPGIRKQVQLLRDSGINTFCSCEHEMTVDIDLGGMDDLERIGSLLVDNGYTAFKINSWLAVPPGGFWIRRATINFKRWKD